MRASRYPSDLSDGQWALVTPHRPACGAAPSPAFDLHAQILVLCCYLLRTGSRWRRLPAVHPGPPVHGYFRRWRAPASCFVSAASSTSRPEWLPGVALAYGRHHRCAIRKATGRGGVRGFDGYKRVKGASATCSSTRSACCFPSACTRPMRRTSTPRQPSRGSAPAMAHCPDHLRQQQPRGTRLGERAVSAQRRAWNCGSFGAAALTPFA